ncbi:Ca(2+)-dependent cysteine protease, partial [Spiromyces aspiralis]
MASVTTPPYTPVTAAGDGGTHHDSSRAKADAKSAALGPPSPQHVPTIAEELDRRQARARASTQIFASQPESLLPYNHPALHNNGNGGGEYYNRTSIFVSTNYSHSPPLPQRHPPHPHVSNPMSAFPLQDPNRANTFAMDSGGSSDLNLQPQPYQKPPLMLHHSLTTIGVYNDDTSTPWASSASLSATSVTEPSHLAQQQQFSHYTRPVSIATTTSVPPAISAASTLTPDSQYFVPPPPQPLPLSQAPTAYHQKYHGVLSTCTGKKRALIITINYYSKPYSLSGVINVGDPLREMLVQSYGYPRADIH